MAINFYLEKRPDKTGDVAIRVSITIRGTRYLTSTGLKATPAKWDVDRQRARKGSVNASGMAWSALNAALARISEHFVTYENDCFLNNVTPSADDLKAEYAREFGRKRATPTTKGTGRDLGFWDYFDMFVRERSQTNQWTVATHQKFNALRNHITGWKKQPTFDDFDEDGMNAFVCFLRDKKQMLNSTIGKQIGFTKWFLRWAATKGYNTNMAFQTFTPKLKTAANQVVFLEWAELMRVFNYEVPEEGTVVALHGADGEQYTKTVQATRGLRAARDIFCFCCFTSLRYSDAANLKLANIRNDSLTITTVKTTDTITIELNKYARAVLERCAGESVNGYALPRLTNQKMNKYLKELCELCEINQPVSHTYFRGSERTDVTVPKYEMVGTHTGRRTFICNALMLGIPAEIVMKWTGHADYKSMKPYVDIANSAKAKAMSLFDKL